jgi:hypothetical protein
MVGVIWCGFLEQLGARGVAQQWSTCLGLVPQNSTEESNEREEGRKERKKRKEKTKSKGIGL